MPAASESAPEQPVSTSSSSQSRTVPPTPVSLQRLRTLAADPATADENGTPSPSVTRRPQSAFWTKFGVPDPNLPPKSKLSLNALLEEVTGGRSQEWINEGEIHLQGCFDWLLNDDKEVVEMLGYERRLIKHHHHNKEPWEFPMSLAHQAARQDPGMYLLVAAFLQNLSIVAVPYKGEGSFFVEYDLDDPTGNTRVTS